MYANLRNIVCDLGIPTEIYPMKIINHVHRDIYEEYSMKNYL